jgi:FkbM family methyltransferase
MPGGDRYRSAVFRAARFVRADVCTTRGSAVFHVSTRDRVLGRHVYVYGDFEAAILHRTYALLREWGRPITGTMVDVGANVGTTCIQAVVDGLAPGAIAIEPEPRNFALLERNMRANGLAGHIEPLRAALSDREGTADLELSEDNSGDHRIRIGAGGTGTFHEDRRATRPVPMTTFDRLVESGRIDLARTGIVWIDVQGHDGHVLAGARTLRDTGIPVVVEFWPYGLDRSAGLNQLEGIIERDYRWFVDLRATTPERRPGAEIGSLRKSIRAPYFTDLLLLKH